MTYTHNTFAIRTVLFFLVFSPVIVFGATATTFEDLMKTVIDVVNIVVPIIVSLALVAFLFGLMKMLFSAGDSTMYKEGGTVMTYGLFSLFVIVALWGIVEIAQQSIFGTTSVSVDAPETFKIPQ